MQTKDGPITRSRFFRTLPAGFDRAPVTAWRGWADIFGVFALGSNVVIVWWWLWHYGIQKALHVNAPGSASLLAGLLASNLMVIQVLMVARIPVIEQAWGQDTLTRRHRLFGYVSFWLMVGHVVLVVWGFALQDLARLLPTLWRLSVDEPGVLLAEAGTLLIVSAVGLSIRRARRRLRYETWHLIHLYTYLGMGLALPHQLLLDADLRENAWAWYYLLTLYVAAAVLVLVYRVALPLWRSRYHQLRVIRTVAETPGVTSVFMQGRHLDRLPLSAGQFFVWRFLDGPGWTRGHPYSVSRMPRDNVLRISVQAVGDGSSRIPVLPSGTRVLIEGPYGRLTARGRTKDRVLFLAAGAGIAPIRALAEEMPYLPGHATLIYRAATVEDLLFTAELDTLADRRGLAIHRLTGHRRSDRSWLPESCGFARTDADVLAALTTDITETDVYVCGPTEWMRHVRTAATELKTPRTQIHSEDFSW